MMATNPVSRPQSAGARFKIPAGIQRLSTLNREYRPRIGVSTTEKHEVKRTGRFPYLSFDLRLQSCQDLPTQLFSVVTCAPF